MRCLHGGLVRSDLRRFADDGEVDVGEFAAVFAHQLGSVCQKARRIRAAPLRVAWREMLADVAQRHRAQHRVGDGVKRDIGIAVPVQALVVLDPNAAQPQLLTCNQSVDVKPMPMRVMKVGVAVVIAISSAKVIFLRSSSPSPARPTARTNAQSGCHRSRRMSEGQARCAARMARKGKGLRRLNAPQAIAIHGGFACSPCRA